VIPSNLVGLVLFAASLGPGYVYVRVAEKRKPRPDRSALVETVEMIAIGGMASTLAALIVLSVGDALDALDTGALANSAKDYLLAEPVRVLGSLVVLFALSYGGAAIAALLMHRRHRAVFKPGTNAWQEVFWWGRDSRTDVTLAHIELRDGRRIAGKLRTFTAESEDNREIALVSPIAAQTTRGGRMEHVADRFVVLREADILYITGGYWPGQPAPAKTGYWQRMKMRARRAKRRPQPVVKRPSDE
jgi:hypothetical protein